MIPRKITRHQIHGESGTIPDGEVVATVTDGPRGALTVWVAHPARLYDFEEDHGD